MRVRVQLLGVFRGFSPSGGTSSSVDLDFGEEAITLCAVRERLGIPEDYPRIVFSKGLPVEDDHRLEDGEELVFVSPIAGG